MKKSYQGSCHCGAVRFEADIDLGEGTSRCNCSICSKGRVWKSVVMAEAFRLLRGKENLSEYQFGRKNIHHYFCRRCGVKPFGSGHMDPLGAFYAINIACLDGVADVELAQAPIQYENGRNDDYDSPPAETRHL